MIENTVDLSTTGFSQDELHEVANRALKAATAGPAEVVISAHNLHLTRFANNQIHQNVSERNLKVMVRVAVGQKVGQAITNDLSDEAIRRAVANAEDLARFQPDNPEFPGFAEPQSAKPVDGTVERTLAFQPVDRAAVVQRVCKGAHREGLTAAGAFTTGLRQMAIANSNGLYGYQEHSLADFNTVVMSEDSSGWSAAVSTDAGEIDGDMLAEEAIGKALRSRRPQPLEPGVYTVVLEEYAVLDLLQYLDYGFGAEEVREGQSFMSGRLGEKLVHEDINVYDDGRDASGIPWAFDFEGTPKQRVELIECGRVGSPVYDLRLGKLEGRGSTGHHSGGSEFWGSGAKAWNVFMEPGQHTKEQMLESTERGIWVTRFHYCNLLDSRKTTLTGMTRDGTFLIENGKLAKPLLNLRFTHAILDALRDVEMIGKLTKMERNWYGGANRAPALKISNFRFTGKTNF